MGSLKGNDRGWSRRYHEKCQKGVLRIVYLNQQRRTHVLVSLPGDGLTLEELPSVVRSKEKKFFLRNYESFCEQCILHVLCI